MTEKTGLRAPVRLTSGRNRPPASPWLLVDALIWGVVLVAAIWMRFDFAFGPVGVALGSARFYWVVICLILLNSIVGWTSGLYRGRFVPGSFLEASVLAFVFGSSATTVFLVHVVAGNADGVPRSTPLIAGAFAVLAALTLRSMVRRRELFGAGVAENAAPALVFGAGDGGLQLVRQLRRSEVSQYNPVGILDDDPAKRNMVIDRVRVFGGREMLEELADRTGATTLLIAVPSLAASEIVELRDRAEAAGMHVLILPPLRSMMHGRVAANELREINVDDLLGRSPARLNQSQIANYLRGKRIMVTGAGGSIGSELCRQLVRFRPGELMMLDRDESGLHAVQLSIQDQAMLDGEDTILASIRDRQAVREIFAARRPQIVFHAAALKHMPLLEHYPREAFKTNVVGTQILLEAARDFDVETFVNISTDKAANPSSVLGHSKRIAERLTAAAAETSTESKYVSVRFGNVLGSRGSVLTVFEKQIAEGGPVTVTDPEVERFFMTIPEACQLVLQAAAVGESGSTLVLDMGEPVKIADVAKTLIENSGQEIEIVYTGLRLNEKLSEELFDDSETVITASGHSSLSVVKVAPARCESVDLESVSESSGVYEWLTRHSLGASPEPVRSSE